MRHSSAHNALLSYQMYYRIFSGVTEVCVLSVPSHNEGNSLRQMHHSTTTLNVYFKSPHTSTTCIVHIKAKQRTKMVTKMQQIQQIKLTYCRTGTISPETQSAAYWQQRVLKLQPLIKMVFNRAVSVTKKFLKRKQKLYHIIRPTVTSSRDYFTNRTS